MIGLLLMVQEVQRETESFIASSDKLKSPKGTAQEQEAVLAFINVA